MWCVVSIYNIVFGLKTADVVVIRSKLIIASFVGDYKEKILFHAVYLRGMRTNYLLFGNKNHLIAVLEGRITICCGGRFLNKKVSYARFFDYW